MNVQSVEFTINSQHDLADIYVFQVLDQEVPYTVETDKINSIRKTSVFILSNLPESGKLYGYKGAEEIRTIVVLKKYMIFYHYNAKLQTVNVLHIFCTLMNEKLLQQELEKEGIFKRD